jgi:hypothetical protein
MPDESKPTDDSRQRELEKREAKERETEDDNGTEAETRGDVETEAVRDGVEGAIASRSD